MEEVVCESCFSELGPCFRREEWLVGMAYVGCKMRDRMCGALEALAEFFNLSLVPISVWL